MKEILDQTIYEVGITKAIGLKVIHNDEDRREAIDIIKWADINGYHTRVLDKKVYVYDYVMLHDILKRDNLLDYIDPHHYIVYLNSNYKEETICELLNTYQKC